MENKLHSAQRTLSVITKKKMHFMRYLVFGGELFCSVKQVLGVFSLYKKNWATSAVVLSIKGTLFLFFSAKILLAFFFRKSFFYIWFLMR
jgi:hypothetical protein